MIKRIIYNWLNIHPEAMSFKQGLDLTGIPICSFKQGESTINFILDTGSDISIIDKNFISSIEHEKVEGIEGTVYGIEGNRTKVEICKVPFTYKNAQYTFPFYVKDMSAPFTHIKKDHGVTVHGLLGSGFFTSFKYIIDFDSLIAYSKNNV